MGLDKICESTNLSEKEVIGLFAAAKESFARSKKILDDLRDKIIDLVETKGHEDSSGKLCLIEGIIELSLSRYDDYEFVDDYEHRLQKELNTKDFENLYVKRIDTKKVDELLHSGKITDEFFLSLKKRIPRKKLNYRIAKDDCKTKKR